MILKAATVSEQEPVVEALRAMCDRSQQCGLVRVIDRYLEAEELRVAIHACAPDVVFVDVDSIVAGVATVKALRSSFPELQVVSVISRYNSQSILELMTAGVREVISSQATPDEFLELIDRIGEKVKEKPVSWGEACRIVSFVPAKAGAGATTIAIDTAVRLSNGGARALLVDLDLNSGLISFLLQVVPVKGLFEAAKAMNRIDETLWREFVVAKGPLDVLVPVELGPSTRIDPLELHNLISFSRRLYDFICLDHSGNLERLSLELMRVSRQIFLVCTPEIPSLHLARQRLQLLQEMELGNRVSVLVNRSQKGAMLSTDGIEKLLGVPIFMELPNDYHVVQKSALAGSICDENSRLGRQCAALTDWIARRERARLAPAKRRRFVDYVYQTVGIR